MMTPRLFLIAAAVLLAITAGLAGAAPAEKPEGGPPPALAPAITPALPATLPPTGVTPQIPAHPVRTSHHEHARLLRGAGLVWTPDPARWTPAWIRIRAAEETGDDEALLSAYLFHRRAMERREAFERKGRDGRDTP